MMTAVLLIGLALVAGITVAASYRFGFIRGYTDGAVRALERNLLLETDDPVKTTRQAQPLVIRYAMALDADHSHRPVDLKTGRVTFNDMTWASWMLPDTHREIRRRLLERHPGGRIIGYAAIDQERSAG